MGHFRASSGLHRTTGEQSAARSQMGRNEESASWLHCVRLLAAAILFLSIAGALVSPDALAAGSKSSKTKRSAESKVTQSLDEQVQEIKSDVLSIAAELSNLEERLLYPSDTHVAVFVSFEKDKTVALDSARITIDGELVAHHIYSFKELEALEKGGVQRIYTGNVPTGGHRLEVTVIGKRAGGKDFEATDSFGFDKEIGPKLLGIKLAADTSGDATIAIEGW